MPYIRQVDRPVLTPKIELEAVTAGELNFQLTEVIKSYVKSRGLSYQTVNDIVGALEGAKLEFYRRVAAPYEDTKIAANGDVYP